MRKKRKTAVAALTRLLRGGSAPVPLPVLLDMWRHGFGGWSYIYYELHEQSRFEAYLPDLAMRAVSDLNGPVAKLLATNKLVFERVAGRFVRVPEVRALLSRGTVVPLGEGSAPGSLPALLAEVRAHGPVILKPVDGGKGRGVYRLEAAAEGLLLNGAAVTDEEATRRLAGLEATMVNPLVPNAPYAEAIFPAATNTVRVVTMIDPASGEPFVAASVHRFGSLGSAPTDNASRGGVTVRVDPETGELGYVHALDARGRVRHWDVHPDTGAPVRGVVVPGWRRATEALLDTARKLPMLLYVGWDVVVGEDGITLLEVNTTPSLHVQAHFPYLEDARIRRFLEHHGVVRA